MLSVGLLRPWYIKEGLVSGLESKLRPLLVSEFENLAHGVDHLEFDSLVALGVKEIEKELRNHSAVYQVSSRLGLLPNFLNQLVRVLPYLFLFLVCLVSYLS